MILVVDIETDGLYEECTKIHCIVAKNVDTGDITESWETDTDIKEGIQALQEADQIIMHNGIDFDIRVIEKLYGVNINVNNIIDTYLLSIMLDPHRKKHQDCRKGGPHSLANWGYIVGKGKPDHEDWSVFSKDMLHRCIEDVKITELTAKHLGVL